MQLGAHVQASAGAKPPKLDRQYSVMAGKMEPSGDSGDLDKPELGDESSNKPGAAPGFKFSVCRSRGQVRGA